MTINFDAIRLAHDDISKMNAAEAELARFSPDDPPCLTDIYLNLNNGGQELLIALERREKEDLDGGKPFLWHILAKVDEWGNVPQPGEAVTRTKPANMKTLKHSPVRSDELNSAIVDGSFAERYEKRRNYAVDSKGCIKCSFTDAGYFLFNWGVHYKTGRPLMAKAPHSTEPHKAPNGDMLHLHYYRYAEVPAAEYPKLPDRVAAKQPKKRGLDVKDNSNTSGDK